jgi:hypothetical protein
MSETLYNTEYYESLVAMIDKTLKKDGVVIIGSKTFYFGLGGGFFEFQKFLSAGKFTLEVYDKINDMKSIERMILIMRRRGEPVTEAIQQESGGFTLSF